MAMAAEKMPLWIQSASDEEIQAVRDMELELARLEARRAELMFKKMVLTNRCCQRTKGRHKGAKLCTRRLP